MHKTQRPHRGPATLPTLSATELRVGGATSTVGPAPRVVPVLDPEPNPWRPILVAPILIGY